MTIKYSDGSQFGVIDPKERKPINPGDNFDIVDCNGVQVYETQDVPVLPNSKVVSVEWLTCTGPDPFPSGVYNGVLGVYIEGKKIGIINIDGAYEDDAYPLNLTIFDN